MCVCVDGCCTHTRPPLHNKRKKGRKIISCKLSLCAARKKYVPTTPLPSPPPPFPLLPTENQCFTPCTAFSLYRSPTPTPAPVCQLYLAPPSSIIDLREKKLTKKREKHTSFKDIHSPVPPTCWHQCRPIHSLLPCPVSTPLPPPPPLALSWYITRRPVDLKMKGNTS